MKSKPISAETRSRRAWYFYDFGNSAYASIILLAVYSTYFKNVVVGGAEGTRLWGIAVGIAAVLVAAVSPILGAIADFTKFKKKFLMIFTALSIVFTALLFFVRKGDVFTGMIFFIIAEIGYRAAQVFYDALLADVSTPETVGSISGKGWAIGMVGGILALLFVLPIQLVGSHMTSYAFLVTAVFYLISSIPTILWVKETSKAEALPAGKTLLTYAFKKLIDTFHSIRSYKEFIKYTVAFLIYNDGIMMLMDFAAIIGATLFGLNQVQLIIFVVIIQLAGAFGALIFGRIADRKSCKSAILYSLIILIISITCLFFIHSMTWFFIVGFFTGFSLSGAQAVSRSMVIQLTPPEKVTEFYGFLSVAGRTSTFVGPLVFGTITFRTNNWYANHGFSAAVAEQYSLYWGIGSIILFLVLGMGLLLFVKKIVVNDKRTSGQSA